MYMCETLFPGERAIHQVAYVQQGEASLATGIHQQVHAFLVCPVAYEDYVVFGFCVLYGVKGTYVYTMRINKNFVPVHTVCHKTFGSMKRWDVYFI